MADLSSSFTGWRAATPACALACFIVAGLNIGLVVYADGKYLKDEHGNRILYAGDCDRAQTTNTGLHVVINLLATIVLAVCNYGMQVASAPNRGDLDASHARGRWFTVGVRSVSNLKSLPPWRIACFVLLGVCSVPLHFLYNSTIIPSIPSSELSVFAANIAAMDAQTVDISFGQIGKYKGNTKFLGMPQLQTALAIRLLEAAGDSPDVQRLENADCIEAYSNPLQTKYGHVIVVSDSVTQPDAASISKEWTDEPVVQLRTARAVVDFNTLTAMRNNTPWPSQNQPDALSHADQWTPFENKVLYCIAETIHEECRLLLNEKLVIVIIVLHILSVATLVALMVVPSKRLILTIGDAVVSFLERPDRATADMSMRDREHFGTNPLLEIENGRSIVWSRVPVYFNAVKRRWFHVVYLESWICYCLWCLGLFIASAVALGKTVTGSFSPATGPNQVHDFPGALALGLGKMNIHSLMSYGGLPDLSPGALASAPITVNIPQLALTFLYLFTNNILTRMLTEAEWNSFASKCKGLRVSFIADGAQRTSLYLQVPFLWSILFIAMFSLLHFLLSQSIFIAAITNYGYPTTRIYNPSDPTGLDRSNIVEKDLLLTAFSPLALFLFTLTILLLFSIIGGLSFRKLKGNMPLLGNCSAVLAAACHYGNTNFKLGESPALQRVQWGEHSNVERKDGHCTFSPDEVDGPREGGLYT